MLISNIFLGVFELIKSHFHEILFHFPMTTMAVLGVETKMALKIFSNIIQLVIKELGCFEAFLVETPTFLNCPL